MKMTEMLTEHQEEMQREIYVAANELCGALIKASSEYHPLAIFFAAQDLMLNVLRLGVPDDAILNVATEIAEERWERETGNVLREVNEKWPGPKQSKN
jgi:hypothetical protein